MSVKLPTGIIASAVIAILGSLVSLVFAGITFLGAAAIATSATPPAVPGQPVPSAGMFATLAVLYGACGVWGIASTIGLLRLKNWARWCFLVFGGLLALFSIFGAAGAIMGAAIVPPAGNVSPELLTGVFGLIGVVCLTCLAIAIWWLVYFNRTSVKTAFLAEAAPFQPGRLPVTISIIAGLLIAGSLAIVVQILVSYPILLFGFVLRGLPASFALALFGAVSLSAGIGLLKRRAGAHSLAVGYFGIGMLNAASSLVVPGALQRMQDLVRETQGTVAAPALAKPFMVFGALVGVAFAGTVFALLIRARQGFMDACRPS